LIDDKIIYDLLIDTFEKLGYIIKNVNFYKNELDGVGNIGRMFDVKIIMLDKKADLKQKTLFLIEELKKIDTGNIFLSPVIRTLIKEEI